MSSTSEIAIAINKKIEISPEMEKELSKADEFRNIDGNYYYWFHNVEYNRENFTETIDFINESRRKDFAFIEIQEYDRTIKSGDWELYGLDTSVQITKPW